MKNCDKFETGIQALIAGNPQLDQLEELVEHCKTCPDCRALFEMHRTLSDIGSKVDELEPADLEGARRSVVEQVVAKTGRRSRSRWFAALRTPFTMRPLSATALMALVFILGMAAYHYVDRFKSVPTDWTEEALSDASLTDAENSPYGFSNVAVNYLNDNRISLSFDISKRVAIVEPANSERVKKILMHSYSTSPTGVVGHFQTKSVKGKFFY
jgi:hypothetical protein